MAPHLLASDKLRSALEMAEAPHPRAHKPLLVRQSGLLLSLVSCWVIGQS